MSKTLELKLPDPLLHLIEKRAREHGVSVEEQAVRELSFALQGAPVDEQILLDEIRAEREAMAASGVFLTDEFLKRAKAWGRK